MNIYFLSLNSLQAGKTTHFKGPVPNGLLSPCVLYISPHFGDVIHSIQYIQDLIHKII